MTVNMLNLPVQPPIYQDVTSLPVNTNNGAMAVVLTSPPGVYVFENGVWDLVSGGGGTGVIPSNAPPNEFCNGINGDGVILYAQPAFSNLAGTCSVAQGGTGINSYTIGDILYASNTTTLSRLADVATGNALISGGVGTAPSWGKIGLTTHVSGILPGANGGTGVANTGRTIDLSSGATGKVLTSDASGNGSWSDISGIGVSSIIGTANQVLANGFTGAGNPQTGSVTLTLPQSIATSSFVQFGALAINQGFGTTSNTKLWLTGDQTIGSTDSIAFNAYFATFWRFYGSAGSYAYSITPSNTSIVIRSSTTATGAGNPITWKDGLSVSSITGNVGISLTNPTYPLHISSVNNANAAGSPSILLYGDANKERFEIQTSQDAVIKLSKCNGTIGSPTVIVNGTALGSYQFAGYDGTAYNRSAWVQAFGTETWSSTARGTDMAFFTTPNASTTIQERMRITQRGNVYIGDSNLTHRLDVYDDVNSATVGRIRNANAGSSAFSAFYLGNNGGNVLALFLNSSARSTDGGTNGATIRNDAGALSIQSSGSNGLYLAPTTGYVGLYNTNPTTAKLVIGGTAGQEGLDLASSDQYANLRVIRSSLSGDKHMYIGLGSGATSNLYFYSNNVNGMTFSGGGNLALSGQLAVAGASFNVGTLTVLRGDTSNLGTAVFYGSGTNTHINYSTTEDTYIRGGKVTSTTYINDANTSGTLRLNNTSAPLLFFSSFNSTYYNNVNFRFYQEFTSSLQGITTSVSVNHGLGGTPTWFQVYIQCVSANAGYSVGDQVMVANYYTPSDSINTAWCSSTQVGYRGTTRIVIADKGTTNAIAITVASWNFIFKAWRAI